MLAPQTGKVADLTCVQVNFKCMKDTCCWQPASKVPATGVSIGGILCRVESYADNLAPLAGSAEDLQGQLAALHTSGAQHVIECDVECCTTGWRYVDHSIVQ